MHHFWYNEVTCVNYQDWQNKTFSSWDAIQFNHERRSCILVGERIWCRSHRSIARTTRRHKKRLLLMKHVSDSSVFFFMNPSNMTWILSFVPPEQSWNFLISITLIRLQRSFRQVCSGYLSRFSKKTRRPPRVIHIFETIFWLGNQQHNSFDFVTCGLRGKCRVQLVPVEIVVRTSQ